MKKVILALAMLFGTMSMGYANQVSVISGTWNRKTAKPIMLFKVENGALKELASSQLTGGNRFAFAFTPEREGFYVIGQNGQSSVSNYTFYFKPGDMLNVTVDPKGYTLTGDNTPENKELAAWHDFVEPLEEKAVYFMTNSSTYVDFFPLLEEKLEQLSNYNTGYAGNPGFSEAFKSLRKYDILLYALSFVQSPRSAHPQGEDFPDYYRLIDLSDVTSSTDLLKYPYGMRIISACQLVLPTIKADDFTEEQKKAFTDRISSLSLILPQISNDTIKGETVLMAASSTLKTYEGFLDYEEKYGKYLITDNQKQRMKDVMLKVADNSKGQQAVNFKFPDITGKEIALSDLKGKIVYIDVWATWCVPCIKEIPALKSLEKEYRGKDIVFLSISVDASKDYEKWKKYVNSNELEGVQLFAGDKASAGIMKPYKITGIPRFMLVDKAGKMVTDNAPRPSTSEIKPLLDALLKK